MKQILCLAFLIFVSCGYSSKKSEKSIQADSIEEVKLEDNGGANAALIFINGYIEESFSTTDITEWAASNASTTASFRAELKRIMDEAYENDPELGLGFDPILDAQDFPDEGFELDYDDEENNFVFLKGKGQEQFKLVVKIIKEDNEWLIDGCGIINIPDSILQK